MEPFLGSDSTQIFPMSLHNLLAYCQSYARTRILPPAVQTLKDDKDTVGVPPVYANAVISHGEQPFTVSSFRSDVDL